MDWTNATIEEAYKLCYRSGAVNATIGIVSVICLGIMIYRIVKIFEEEKEKGSTRTLFEIIKQYAKYYVFILVFPLILPFAETLLAKAQDKINTEYSSSINEATEIAVKEQVKRYIEEEKDKDGFLSKAIDSLSPFSYIRLWLYTATLNLFVTCLFILKYMYFFFVAGRYLWLLMLEMLAPIAIVCGLWQKTENITVSFFKNLVICYMLVPFYLLANTFSEAIIKVLVSGLDLNAYGIFGILGMILIKFSMFAIATKRAFKVLN